MHYNISWLSVPWTFVMLVTEWLTFHISSGSGDTGFSSHEGTISVERQAEEQTKGGPKNSKESGQGGKIQVS